MSAGVLDGAAPVADFAETLRRFTYQGQPTLEVAESGLRYFVNEFWTSGQRRGHSLHEISYRACFKPQLPGFFIERLTRPGDRVYDPFAGRGTTPVEAALLGRAPAANDVNPLSAMLTAPRLAPPPLEAVAARLAALDLSVGVPDPAGDDLLAFYHPETLRQVTALRAWLLGRPAPDPVDAWIRMVALNRLTGHSPGFFSVYTMPPNQAVSAASQRRINARRGQVPPVRDVRAIVLKKSRGLLADGVPPPHPPAVLMTGPSDRAAGLADGSVDLVVTSPPFLDVVDYEGDNWLRCWFAGIDPASVVIARHRDTAAWEAFVRRTFESLARVVRPGGFVAFEVGEVRGGRVLLERNVVAAIAGLPFTVLGVMVNEQEFTKTANCWGVGNNDRGTNTNRIVLAVRGSPP
ncbi:MAG TPA: DNA methyltransferase [Rhodopila sp.]|uniref:DNA methyltransferase n=1 Tax=Rhodopila sp. TaxID=2480087 RepID=UPI002B52F0DD|nr:DNA methyltransferase [Rhodopila sp.]HVY17331.1 DNA methyltransferase [Rhodopila sp.]